MSWLGPDRDGLPSPLATPPRRIVSLVPSQTELLAALGLDAETVGLTRFCVHPADWKARKQIIGGTKNVRVDRVRQLAPDLVIANKEENVREQVEAIAAFAPVWVTDVADVDGALAMIRDVGAATGRWPAADLLAQDIGDDFDTLSEAPPLRALYLIWRDPWMTVGDDTIIADVLRRGGFTNAAEGQTRYPSLSDDEFATLAPDVVLLSSEPYPFQDKHLDEVQALVPGVPVLLVDGEPFSWYGPRLAHAPAALRDIRQRLASRG